MRASFIGASLLLILLAAAFGGTVAVSGQPDADVAAPALGVATDSDTTAAMGTSAAPSAGVVAAAQAAPSGAATAAAHVASTDGSPLGGSARAAAPAPLAYFGEPVGPPLPPEQVTLYVASETTHSVRVFRGNPGEPASMKEIARIPTGQVSHNLGSSLDGRWVATPNRVSGDVTIIDTGTMKEVARVKVGRRPHDPAFSADGRLLFVSQEGETYTSVIEVGTWRRLPNIEWGIVQHDIATARDGRHLWMTVGNIPFEKEKRRLWVYDLQEKRVVHRFETPRDAHDLVFDADFRELWLSNSGYPTVPDPWMTIWDVAAQRVAHQLDTGGYPFHSPRWGKDGNHMPPGPQAELWFTDRTGRAVFAVHRASRRIVARLPAEGEPFHLSMSPGGYLFCSNFGSHSVSIYDTRLRKLLGTLPVPGPHGLSVVVRG